MCFMSDIAPCRRTGFENAFAGIDFDAYRRQAEARRRAAMSEGLGMLPLLRRTVARFVLGSAPLLPDRRR